MKRKVLKVISAVMISGLIIANITIVMAEQPGGGVDTSCDAGGPGSSSCTIRVEGSVVGSGGSFSCSVTCGSGYYACCSISKLSCNCKSNSGGSGGGSSCYSLVIR